MFSFHNKLAGSDFFSIFDLISFMQGMNTDGICTGTMLPNGSEGHMDRKRDRPQATPHPRQARELKPWLLTERELEVTIPAYREPQG